MVPLFAEIASINFWSKTMDYSQAFCSISLRTHNSSLEGATELKFVPFCFPTKMIYLDYFTGSHWHFLHQLSTSKVLWKEVVQTGNWPAVHSLRGGGREGGGREEN